MGQWKLSMLHIQYVRLNYLYCETEVNFCECGLQLYSGDIVALERLLHSLTRQIVQLTN